MNQKTQIEFKKLIASYLQSYKFKLNLGGPFFEEEGFITKARMTSPDGYVEIRCGPAEYHAEIFIFTAKDQRRWCLVDLIGMKSIKSWMSKNHPIATDRSRLEAEIDYAFRLVSEGLKDVSNFDWLHLA